MAQTGNHTPGPWVAHYLPQHRMRVTAYDETPLACSICDIALWNVDYGEQQANASLIAAAPEMLAALKEAETEIRELREWVDRHVPAEVVASEKWAELHKPAVTTTVLRNLRTAIAKAEGR